MSSNYLNILQLTDSQDPDQLERAYHASIDRYQRLTRSGPLRFYRNDLIADTQLAYRQLKRLQQQSSHKSVSAKSFLARCADKQDFDFDNTKPPVQSPVKNRSLTSDLPQPLKSRSLDYYRSKSASGQNPTAPKEKAQREDQYCRDVIYRLEGDLIRYDSRQELLKIAQNLDIAPFRANMLIAQIVEAVRQNKLYQPSKREIKEKIPDIPTPTTHRRLPWIALAVIAITLLEYWLLRRWGGS